MSFQGEPSARDRCHVQLWGSVLETIEKPLPSSAGMTSGAGASIQSTWPESSAADRALGSGSGISTIRSSCGTRSGSQYSAKGTSSARSRGTKLSRTQGPVPDGFSATASQLLPGASQFMGDDINIHASG